VLADFLLRSEAGPRFSMVNSVDENRSLARRRSLARAGGEIDRLSNKVFDSPPFVSCLYRTDYDSHTGIKNENPNTFSWILSLENAVLAHWRPLGLQAPQRPIRFGAWWVAVGR
jgi:hypothetical protein